MRGDKSRAVSRVCQQGASIRHWIGGATPWDPRSNWIYRKLGGDPFFSKLELEYLMGASRVKWAVYIDKETLHTRPHQGNKWVKWPLAPSERTQILDALEPRTGT